MLNQELVFSIIYALAARDGRNQTLFGDNLPLASQAFRRSLATESFPELWFELPLKGKPWFDLHALTSREDVSPDDHYLAERCGGVPEVFEWFAHSENTRQLALSYDVSSGDIEHPAVQLLMMRDDLDTSCSFLEAAGRPDASEALRPFIRRMPNAWYCCYMGVFPSRPQSFLRVECIPTMMLRRRYATEGSLLGEDLAKVGLEGLDEEVIRRCRWLLGLPFQGEFQFDIGADGRALDTFSASVRLNCPPGTPEWQAFGDDGAARELMERLGEWGLADRRWTELVSTAFAQRITFGKESVSCYCYPAFVKLRWRKSEPVDAKAYLIAGISED